MANNNKGPIITATVIDTNEFTVALTGDNKKLVRGLSNAFASMTAKAQNGAVIDNDLYIIRNGNKVGYGTSYTFTNVDDGAFAFSAADNYGNVSTETVFPPMVNYFYPTCNMENKMPDALGHIDVMCTGIFFNDSFGAVDNTLSVGFRYQKPGDPLSDLIPMSITLNGNFYGAYASFTIPNFDSQATYIFVCEIEDKITSALSKPIYVKSTPVFHWGENDFVFEVPVSFKAGMTAESSGTKKIDGDLNVTGDLRLKGSGNYGNTLRFGDGNYCRIYEAEDDVMTIAAKKIILSATKLYNGASEIPITATGIWSPSLDSSYISSYSAQLGWYSKVGDTVTVGFYIKATCLSGGIHTAVKISGLPFTPMYTGSGGGICSGVYVSAGFNFQCFAAETNGTITTRVQACNNTSATNLSTSSTGCFYRSGGGEITLSGTITYMANSYS